MPNQPICQNNYEKGEGNNLRWDLDVNASERFANVRSLEPATVMCAVSLAALIDEHALSLCAAPLSEIGRLGFCLSGLGGGEF